jgi:hypothetical protein
MTGPVITGPQDENLTYVDYDPPLKVDGDYQLSDTDPDATITSLTASFTVNGGYAPQPAVPLSLDPQYTDGGKISVSWDPRSYALELTGSDTVAAYQTAMQNIAFSYASSLGMGSQGLYTISTTAVDSNGESAQLSAPNGDAPGPLSVGVDVIVPFYMFTDGAVDYTPANGPVALDPHLIIGDPAPATIQSAVVEIVGGALPGDTLNFVAQNGITGTFVDTPGHVALELSGDASVQDYNLALQSITFSSSASDPTAGGSDQTRTFQWTATDVSGIFGTGQSTAVVHCFGKGTRIAAERGEVAVEDLSVGEPVRTASGALRPIRWIGHRELDVSKHRWPLEVMPVRVRAHAFGDNLPRRDLWLSPEHAVLVDGVLIPIIQLANGATVAQQQVKTVCYYHVELDSHDVLLAEGLAAESLIDGGARQSFTNQACVELHPSFATEDEGERCAPLLRKGATVEAWRARLAARAGALGFVRVRDPGLHILADGLRILPSRLGGGTYAFVLPQAARELVLASNSSRPADAGPSCGDRRHLGVVVTRLLVDGRERDLASLGAGWHALESERGRRWRWTDGRAELPPARRVEITLGEPSVYWKAPGVRPAA